MASAKRERIRDPRGLLVPVAPGLSFHDITSRLGGIGEPDKSASDEPPVPVSGSVSRPPCVPPFVRPATETRGELRANVNPPNLANWARSEVAREAKLKLLFRLHDFAFPPVVRNVLLARGWREWDEAEHEEEVAAKARGITSTNLITAHLYWRASRPVASIVRQYNYFGRTRRQNHLPGSAVVTRKDKLMRAVRKLRAAFGTIFNFVPEGYLLPNEYAKFARAFNVQPPNEKALWIVKPIDLSRGRKIFLVRELGDLVYDQRCVIQRYVADPFLIGGYKNDLRLYVLVTSVHPLKAWLYREGLVRFSTRKYDASAETDLTDLYAHLTNASINKDSPDYAAHKDVIGSGCKWTFARWRRYMAEQGIPFQPVWLRIRNLILLSLLPLLSSVKPGAGAFELFGFDVLLDKRLKPWLIEVNCAPSLGQESEADRIKTEMIHDLIDVLDFRGNLERQASEEAEEEAQAASPSWRRSGRQQRRDRGGRERAQSSSAADDGVASRGAAADAEAEDDDGTDVIAEAIAMAMAAAGDGGTGTAAGPGKPPLHKPQPRPPPQPPRGANGDVDAAATTAATTTTMTGRAGRRRARGAAGKPRMLRKDSPSSMRGAAGGVVAGTGAVGARALGRARRMSEGDDKGSSSSSSSNNRAGAGPGSTRTGKARSGRGEKGSRRRSSSASAGARRRRSSSSGSTAGGPAEEDGEGGGEDDTKKATVYPIPPVGDFEPLFPFSYKSEFHAMQMSVAEHSTGSKSSRRASELLKLLVQDIKAHAKEQRKKLKETGSASTSSASAMFDELLGPMPSSSGDGGSSRSASSGRRL